MKAKKVSVLAASLLPKTNAVEVEFHNKNETRTKRKIAIPHGQFSPPFVLHDSSSNQWFLWCSNLGIYLEVEGSVLSSVEVAQ